MTHSLPHLGDPAPEPFKLPLLIRWAGWLGAGAWFVGLGIFLLGCAGYDRPFALYWVPMILGGAGTLLAVVGGVFRHGGVEHTPIVAALFVSLFGFIGGLLQCAVWRGWDIFYRSVSL